MVDFITSLFQAGAVLFLLLNVRQLWRDKELKGISLWMILYFTLWGYWGIYMFWDLKQYWSMLTNIGIAGAYTVWIGLAAFYKVKNRV